MPPKVEKAPAVGGTLREETRRVRHARRVPQKKQLDLPHDDDRAAADNRLRRACTWGTAQVQYGTILHPAIV